jgi:hypothetical protein
MEGPGSASICADHFRLRFATWRTGNALVSADTQRVPTMGGSERAATGRDSMLTMVSPWEGEVGEPPLLCLRGLLAIHRGPSHNGT